MTNDLDQMTALQLTIIAVLFEYHESLFAPVFQHLADGVVGHVGTFDGNRMLHGLLERELDVQSLEDRVVLAALGALTVLSAGIVAAQESVLDAVAEEVEGVLQQRVGNHVVGLEHRGCLRLQQTCFRINVSHTLQSIRQHTILWAVTHTRKR